MASRACRHFFVWNDLCDWYIEMSKEVLYGQDEAAKTAKQNVLGYVLDQTLKLMHPIMPFVTEELWQHMPHEGDSIVVSAYPVVQADLADAQAETQMEHLIDLIRSVRNIRSEVNAPMSSPINVLIKTTDADVQAVFEANKDYIQRFVHPKDLQIGADTTAPKLAMSAVITGAEVYVPLAELIDIDEEVARLQKEADKWQAEVTRADKKLGNERFVANAPEKVVAEQRDKRADYVKKLAATQARIAELKASQA